MFFVFRDSYVLSLWTFDVHFTHSHIMAMVQWERERERDFKVFQYFNNMRHNSAAVDAFDEVIKVMNHTSLWDAELGWYSLSATRQIWSYDLEHSLGIHGFSPTWSCLIAEFLTTQLKFFEDPSGYCTGPSPFVKQMFLFASVAL